MWLAAGTTMIPHMTPIFVNYFASRDAGFPLTCEKELSDDGLKAQCARGSATAVDYVSLTAFFRNAVLGWLVSPLVGWLSDAHGRKPFFLAGLVLFMLPSVWVAVFLHMHGFVDVTVFYLVDTLKGVIVPPAIVAATTADVAAPEWRATLFSLLAAQMCIALFIGAAIGGALSASAAASTSVALYAVTIAVVAAFMQETLPRETREAARMEHMQRPRGTVASAVQSVACGLRDTLSVLPRNAFFLRLAMVTMASGLVLECLQDLMFNYFMVTLGFGAADNAKILTLVGVSGLIVQVGLLPALLKVVSEKWVLVLALASSTLQLVGFATAPTLGGWAVWVSLVVGAPGCMSMPVISALKSVHSGEDEQGKVQGALFAAKGLAQGSGPLLFSALFTVFTKRAHFFPAAPIIALAIVMGFGAAVACTIRVPHLVHCSDGVNDALLKDELTVHSDNNVDLRSDRRDVECMVEGTSSEPLLDQEHVDV